MPYDSADFDSSDSDEVSGDGLPSQVKTKGEILAAFKTVKNEVTALVKRGGTRAIFSAMLLAAAALCAPQHADAQCYAYTSPGASLSVNITNLPAPTTGPDGSGGTNYGYTLTGLSGNSVTVTVGSTPYVLGSPQVFFDIVVDANPLHTSTVIQVSGSVGTTAVLGTVQLLATGGDILPSGWPTTGFPPVSSWNGEAIIYGGISPTFFGPFALTAITDCNAPPPTPAKALGGCNCPETGNQTGAVGQAGVGDPINTGTGNVFERATDYSTTGQNPLGFIRYYNSMEVVSNPTTFATSLGTNWRSNFDRYLNIVSGTAVNAERPDGQVISFTLSGSIWTPDSDVDVRLINTGSTWTLTDHNDTVETYTATGSKGLLNIISARNGYTQTLNYTGTQLTSVTDSYNRSLGLNYTGGLLNTVTTPDGLTLTYGFTPASGGNNLTSVGYSTVPGTHITYQYNNASFPFALTGMLDENNQQYSSWTYDTQGRGNSSNLGGGLNANLTTLMFNTDGTTTVTNAFLVADTYTFATLQGVPKVMQISRAATSTTAAATRTFGYDPNGYLNASTDWNGNSTTYMNDIHGDPTTIVMAAGTPLAETTTIKYDLVFEHLPYTVTTAGLTSTYMYDGGGNPLSRSDLDTTTNTVPYSTGGQTRVTQFTWSPTGEELSVQLPRTDKMALTSFGYDSSGALISIKDALKHLTQITAHTGGGLPLTIVDPNDVTTTLVYDGRLNLNTSTLSTSAGPLTTTWTHDPANNLTALTQPDNSKLTFGYDAAHRLTSTTDLFGNSITNTLDYLGDPKLVQVTNSSSTVTRQHSGVFDALGRVLQDIGGVGQTTVYTWDPNGNALTITPPAPSGMVTQTWDALNRLSTRIDPAPGGTTTYGYDAHDRVLSVKDANSNTTSYVYDGFGDRTQTASPDSGTTVFHYDPDRNLTQRVMPGSLTMNATFDALDRTKTVKYTGDTTLNVTNTYDQPTGHGFGIGRLTSATDQIGSLGLTYDERANVTAETRTPTGLAAQTTSYGYDAASNISSITYPSTSFVQYGRDIMGRVTSVTAELPGAGSASNVATGVTYRPFGPVTGLTYGNGIKGSYGYDLDYRPTTRKDAPATGAAVQNLTYGYFANDSVHTITDAVNAANSQTMTYDTLDRLKTAASGAGGYGTFAYTWDPVSNLVTETLNGTRTTYSHNPGTNRLDAVTTSGVTENVGSTAAGNIATFKTGGAAVETLAYNKANQLASATVTSPAEMASYAYDLMGRREKSVGTTTGTTIYGYDRNSNLLTDNDGSGTTRADYVYLNPQSGPGATPVGTVQPSNNAMYFLHTDRLGTPTTATDIHKTVQWSATYQPFGYTATGMSGIVQDLRLPGQEWDLESGFNHNGFRNYAAQLTRYVESDPIGLAGGMNTYQYVGGNPFKWTDRRGLNVYVGERGAFFPGDPLNHTTLLLVPNNPSDFANNPLFQATNGQLATLGAQAFGPGDGPFGSLTSTPNNPADALCHLTAARLVQTPAGMTDSDFINNLIDASNSYNNSLTYSPFPTINSSTYNSNGFVSGILRSVGATPPILTGTVPGYAYPIPNPK